MSNHSKPLLFAQPGKVGLQEIETRNHHKGAVIWLTGLSGSGKSTISIEAQVELFAMGCNVCILDGDNLRLGLNKDLGFSEEDRNENIRRVAEVARLFYLSGFIVLCAFISPFKNHREIVRSLIPSNMFVEVYIECSVEECVRRDPKGLYKKALLKEVDVFPGISASYEPPETPELVINTEILTIEQSTLLIIRLLKERLIISS